MFKKFISTTVSSILIVGTLGGCSAKDCNPSHPKGGALFGGLGCAMFGGYAKRRAIMDKRVQISVEELQQSVKELQISEKNLQIAKDKNVEKLLEYQRLIAKITEDNRRLQEIEKKKAELERAKREMIALYNKVVEKEELAEQDEEIVIAYNKNAKKRTKSKAKRKQETKKTREEYNQKANEVKDKRIEYRKTTLITSQQKKDVKVEMDMFAEENSKGTLSKSKKDIFEMANNVFKDDLIEKANNEVKRGTTEISFISATLNPEKKAKEEKNKPTALLDNPEQKKKNKSRTSQDLM